MCGIIGIIRNHDVSNDLISGLKRLEYRGYDSAGIAVINNNIISRQRAEGKVAILDELQKNAPISGNIGIGHTRWATHGSPTLQNAHPHSSGNVAVVHNGIIENFVELREQLESENELFETDTDTEVIPKLINKFIKLGDEPYQAVQKTVAKLQGAYALGIIFSDNEDVLIAVKQGSPLAIGHGTNEMYLGSDALTLAPLTSHLSYLDDGDIAVLSRQDVQIFDVNGAPVNRKKVTISNADMSTTKGHYDHYMLKEIYEQPGVIGTTLNAFYHPVSGEISLPNMSFNLKDIPRINIIACGTSFYAAMVAKYWIEQIAKVPVDIDVASEFRYREPILISDGLTIVISQSGETADTLAALRHAKSHGQHSLAIVNVAESTMAREAECYLQTLAGPEIGVASTKAFTTQLIVLASFTMALARAKENINQKQEKSLGNSLAEISSRSLEVLHHADDIQKIANDIAGAQDILYVGRGSSYPIALEGALKLKEISYIHAEATAAGELKHGPIALIDEKTPVIAIAPNDNLFDKTASNIREIAARGGQIILLSDAEGIKKLQDVICASIELPEVTPFSAPILYTIPIQLLAYYVALAKGTDVDQPRNLAKSVTVE